ncbi:MAG: cytoplasmic protein [Desulfarculaceae bacterium]|jgi:hypothetical protein
MPEHSHKFIDQYTGLVGFGFDRPTDEATVQFYLQKFSDDGCMAKILPRLEEQELADIFDLLSLILKRHLSEEEYHSVFLKDHRQEI